MQYKISDELGAIRKRRGVSYYHQLYLLLAAALNDGLIVAGTALPTETDLMERFQVSRNTVRRALGQLEQEKRIIRRRGSGSYARSTPPRVEISVDSIAEVLRDFDSDKSHTSRLVRVQTVATPLFIRRRAPDFEEKSLLVQRCRSFADAPFMFSTSHVPAHLSVGLTRRQLSRQVVTNALEAIGVNPSAAEQTTTATLADASMARHLDIEPFSAVLCIHRLIRDEAGRSIEHQSHFYRSDRYQLRARVTADRSAAGLRWSDTHYPGIPIGL